ncbi:hypothetical protein J6590_013098 [Homalodisca vitripennis]|nr:hypothetical protein J6590_013098 [Homalodisca vitripennis]
MEVKKQRDSEKLPRIAQCNNKNISKLAVESGTADLEKEQGTGLDCTELVTGHIPDESLVIDKQSLEC